MKQTLEKYRKSAAARFIERHEKYIALAFFIGGFIFDWLTLDRIDGLVDMIILWVYFILLNITIYWYNLADDGVWKGSLLEKAEPFFPLAIQFFFGGLSSAYVIYFSRSASMSKSAAFLVIVIFLFIANEFLKSRISNKYLQFGIYFYINFVFLGVMVPVILKEMKPANFLLTGLVSLGTTLYLILYIYKKSPSTRKEIHLGKVTAMILGIYFSILGFYYFRLIPPVPLALQAGVVAHHISIQDNTYRVTYESTQPYIFWRTYNNNYTHSPGDRVYVFSAIFAPTALEQGITHRWKWKDPKTDTWVVADTISYKITGGREEGYRGYTYKTNIREGQWAVEVVTQEDFILGVVEFNLITDPKRKPGRMATREF